MSLNKDLTIVFVSFFSKNIIEKPISQIPSEIPIIVVENSKDIELKSILEKKYENVKVIIPNTNKGNGGGANVGLKQANSKYVLYLDVDVELNKTTIEKLYFYANKLEDFSILGPSIDGLTYKENDFAKRSIYENVHSMKFLTGCALFLNMKAINDIGFFDEKIFLYYEENDLYLRSFKKNYKIYLIEESKLKHYGNRSTDLIEKNSIEINRNWHLMWSTFYFHKKHFGIIEAYKKTILKFFSALLKYLIYLVLQKTVKRNIYFARMSGIFNAVIGKTSWFRTNLNHSIENK